LKQSLDAFGLRHLNRASFSVRANLIGRLLRGIKLRVTANDKGPVRSQTLRRSLTNARTCADHDCHTSIESKEFFVIHLSSIAISNLKF
jgi:hypothetical protein